MSKIKYPIGGYAPGNYQCICESCGEKFIGDKRAVQCEPCAINAINKSNTIAINKLHILKEALRKITFNVNIIDDLLND